MYFWYFKAIMAARGSLWSHILKKVGNNFQLGGACRISGPENIEIGNNVSIENNCSLYGQGGIKIGNNVMIASYIHIISQDHNFSELDKPVRDQGINCKNIYIEDDVWIGINSVILKGVTIGRGSVVGAGSIVTKDIPPYSIAVGNPARVIKSRK